MKKVLICALVMLSSLCFVGCSNKNIQTLKCSVSEKDSGFGMETSMNITMKYDKSKKRVIDGNTVIKMTMPEEYIKLYKELDDSSICDSFEYDYFSKGCKSSIKGNTIEVKAELDVEELYKDATEEDKKATLEDFKKELEESQDGMTCKIK